MVLLSFGFLFGLFWVFWTNVPKCLNPGLLRTHFLLNKLIVIC